MLEQFHNLSSWREENIQIDPNEVYTMRLIDTTPNMFVVINPNPARIKISIGAIPTTDNYETLVDYNSMETFGRPSGTTYLYLLNDSSIPVNLKVFSVQKEFDPVILKNMRVSLENYKVETNTEISGVKDGVALPVTLDVNTYGFISAMNNYFKNLVSTNTYENYTNLKSLLDVLISFKDQRLPDMQSLLQTISDTIKNSSNPTLSNMKDFLQSLDGVVSEIDKDITALVNDSIVIRGSVLQMESYLQSIRTATESLNNNIVNYKVVSASRDGELTIENVEGIVLVKNDSEADVLTITITNTDGSNSTFTMLAGEEFKDLNIKASSITLNGVSRIIYKTA